MEKNYLWLCTSLFCHKSGWHHLLSKGIRPFAHRLLQEHKLTNYYFEFNYSRGDHINFYLLVARDKAEQIAVLTDVHFKSYFAQFGLPNAKDSMQRREIFMPFPVNTIQYGLCPPDVTCHADDADLIFRQEFSSLLIDAFGNDTVTDEKILVTSFYFYVTLVDLIMRNSLLQLDDLLVISFQTTDPGSDLGNMEFFKQKFTENKRALFEITDDILNGNQDIPDFVQWWTHLCETRITAINQKYCAKGDVNHQHTYNKIANLIDTHAGLNVSMKFMVFYLIRELSVA